MDGAYAYAYACMVEVVRKCNCLILHWEEMPYNRIVRPDLQLSQIHHIILS